MRATRYVQVGERERLVEVEDLDGDWTARLDGVSQPVELSEVGDGRTYSLRVGNRVWELLAQPVEGGYQLLADGRPYVALVHDERERRLAAANPRAHHGAGGRVEIKAPMPGLVVNVVVAVGDVIVADAHLLSLEAMKMENELRAPGNGTVVEVRVAAGDKVNQGQVLLVVE